MSRFSTMIALGAAALVAPAAACSVAEFDREEEVSFDEKLTAVQQTRCDAVPEPAPVVPTALTGEATYENEIHDCQRLVVADPSGNTFGPLVGLFPIDAAMRLPVDSFATATGRIVATIFNWESAEAYAPLDIQPGWQCLWLKRSDSLWQAGITPTSGQTCVDPGHGAPDYSLEVEEFHHETLEARGTPPDSIYPATARWEWDQVNEQHYMGIKCADAWCAIGPDGFQPAESNPLVGAKERSVPGWYDAQHLAIPDQGGALRPGPWGSVYPVEGLGSIDSTEFRASNGVHVADIVVESAGSPGGLAHYQDKLFLEVNGSRGTTEVWVGRNTAGAWSSRFRHGNGLSNPAQLRRIPRVRHAVEGAARWRWHDNDETAWYWCGGCCDSGPSLQ